MEDIELEEDMFDNMDETNTSNPVGAKTGGSVVKNKSMRKKIVTTSFGELEFTGLSQNAKFVRLNERTPENKVRTYLSKRWELRPPTLVISVFGGEFEKKRKLKMIFKKGLWKAAESAGCWVLTGAFNYGIMKLAGEAVRDYTDAYGGDRMVCIGVCSWDCITGNSILENGLENMTNAPIIYQSEEDDDDNETKGTENTMVEERPIDSNHNYFFMVDTGNGGHKRGLDMAFRTRFERAISVWPQDAQSNTAETRVPICGLVAGGDVFCLRQVHMSISRNRCPVVIAKGTGGTADAIAVAMKAVGVRNKEDESTKESSHDFITLDTKMENILREYYYELHPDMPDFYDDAFRLREIVIEYNYLVSVFDMEEDSDLDGYMISALLSSDRVIGGANIGSDQLNLGQLEITLTLNRADIARDKIFLENKKWKKGDLNKYMYLALMRDRHEFVKLFLEHGFNLEEFLTVFMLEKLYTDSLQKMTSKSSIFTKLWDYHRSHKKEKQLVTGQANVTLREVGKVIRVLVGDFYHPLYLNKDFQTKLKKTTFSKKNVRSYVGEDVFDIINDGGKLKDFLRSAIKDFVPKHEQQTKADADGPEETKGHILPSMHMPMEPLVICVDPKEKPVVPTIVHDNEPVEPETIGGGKIKKVLLKNRSFNRRDTNNANQDVFEEREDEDQKQRATLDRPARELMIWSILIGKLEMADLFWTMEKEPIAGALLASMLLSSLYSKTDDFSDKEDYKIYARHFEDQAEGVLNECYREDERRAQLLINRMLYYYGRSSAIILAAEGSSIRFMAHPCCQDFLTAAWQGNLSSKNTNSRYFFGVLMGLMFPIIIPKVMMYKDDGDDQLTTDMSSKREEVKANLELGAADHDEDVHFYQNEPEAQKVPAVNEFTKFFNRIRQFYMAPVIRFVYNTISYMIFLLLFSYFITCEFHLKFNILEYIIIGWIITLFFEEIKQAIFSNISFSTYLSDGWNKLDVASQIFFICGFTLRTICLFKENAYSLSEDDQLDIINSNAFFVSARIFYAMSLVIFYVRLMYIFSFHFALGPKLIMIGKMVVNDLIPFMVILIVFTIGYGVAFQSISHPNGYYTHQDNGSFSEQMSKVEIVRSLLSTSYYQMFGDFKMDKIEREDYECRENSQCYHVIAGWLNPVMLSLYVLLTNILMFNLLIAMFSRTYEEVESSSTYHWNFQRYEMIKDYVQSSPLAPPFVIVWEIFEVLVWIRRKCICCPLDIPEEDPFCIIFTDEASMKRERELVKWEHMKAMDFMRQKNESSSRSSNGTIKKVVTEIRSSRISITNPQEGNDQKNIVMAELATPSGGGNQDLSKALEKKLNVMSKDLKRFSVVEERLREVCDMIELLGEVVDNVQTTQLQIMTAVKAIPPCQCTGALDGSAATASSSEHPRNVLEKSVLNALQMAKAMRVFEMPTHAAKSDPVPPEIAQLVSPSDSEDSDANPGKFDNVNAPVCPDASKGRILERTIDSHRIWRIAPFNFEQYAGMRTNVPDDMKGWDVDYPDYVAYQTEEALVYPNKTCNDNLLDVHMLNFNTYDKKSHIDRRSSYNVAYALSNDNVPLNPMGRQGLQGRGMLPFWGPNHVVVILITRVALDRMGKPLKRNGMKVMQYIALERNKQTCIPWYLIDHLPTCNLATCVPDVVMQFVKSRVRAIKSDRKAQKSINNLESASVTQVHEGYMDDHLNADNAWLESVVVMINENEKHRFKEGLQKIFKEKDVDETLRWVEIAHSTSLRNGHNAILKSVAQELDCYF